MLSADIAKTGIALLDAALGGLYWGDNVVWVCDEAEPAALAPFYGAIGEGRESFGLAAYVAVSSDPAEVRRRWPWLDVVDARPRSASSTPDELLETIRAVGKGARRPLLVFDSLGAMASRWGADRAGEFFARCCPMLLDLGAIAYWSVSGGARSRTLLTEVERITQCVLVIEEGRLRIRKAEGRPPGVQGQLFRYHLRGDKLVLQAAPAGARVGAALRAYRLRRDLSQTALARLAGVSPSAISQVERGQRGLSLETLLELASRLNVTLDELLGGEVTPDYRIGRRHLPSDAASVQLLSLLDDSEVGLRAYLVCLQPGESVEAPFSHKGPELVGVVEGLVQVTVGQGRPVLRRGEALLAARRPIAGWRNLGESDASCFWVLGD